MQGVGCYKCRVGGAKMHLMHIEMTLLVKKYVKEIKLELHKVYPNRPFVRLPPPQYYYGVVACYSKLPPTPLSNVLRIQFPLLNSG